MPHFLADAFSKENIVSVLRFFILFVILNVNFIFYICSGFISVFLTFILEAFAINIVIAVIIISTISINIRRRKSFSNKPPPFPKIAIIFVCNLRNMVFDDKSSFLVDGVHNNRTSLFCLKQTGSETNSWSLEAAIRHLLVKQYSPG